MNFATIQKCTDYPKSLGVIVAAVYWPVHQTLIHFHAPNVIQNFGKGSPQNDKDYKFVLMFSFTNLLPHSLIPIHPPFCLGRIILVSRSPFGADTVRINGHCLGA